MPDLVNNSQIISFSGVGAPKQPRTDVAREKNEAEEDEILSPRDQFYSDFSEQVEQISVVTTAFERLFTVVSHGNPNKELNKILKKFSDFLDAKMVDSGGRDRGHGRSDYYEVWDPGIEYIQNSLEANPQAEHIEDLSKGSDYEDLGFQLFTLLKNLDRIISLRVEMNANKNRKKTGTEEKFYSEEDGNTLNHSLELFTGVICKIIEPLNDTAKSIIYKDITAKARDEDIALNLVNLHRGLTQKVSGTKLSKLAPLLGMNPKIHKPPKTIKPTCKYERGPAHFFDVVIDKESETATFYRAGRRTRFSKFLTLHLDDLIKEEKGFGLFKVSYAGKEGLLLAKICNA